MSFVESYYSFNFEVSTSENSHQFRLKIPRHPSESDDYFAARILALIHSYEPGLSYAQHDSLEADPTLWRKDTVGNILEWIEVGCPPERKIRHTIRHVQHDRLPTNFKVYFFQEQQISTFCHYLRGSKTNWVSNIHFYFLEKKYLEALIFQLQSGALVKATLVDEEVYLQINNVDFQLTFHLIDIWSEFQKSIRVD